VVKIVVLRTYGKKIVVADFGGVAVAVDEHGNAARVKDGAAETAAKWEKGDSQIRLFLPQVVGGVKKTVKNGRLYLDDVEVGQVLEVSL
jgi:hypothetical protein